MFVLALGQPKLTPCACLLVDACLVAQRSDKQVCFIRGVLRDVVKGDLLALVIVALLVVFGLDRIVPTAVRYWAADPAFVSSDVSVSCFGGSWFLRAAIFNRDLNDLLPMRAPHCAVLKQLGIAFRHLA